MKERISQHGRSLPTVPVLEMSQYILVYLLFVKVDHHILRDHLGIAQSDVTKQGVLEYTLQS